MQPLRPSPVENVTPHDMYSVTCGVNRLFNLWRKRIVKQIQSEIETMQARLDRLKSEVELSTLSIHLQRRRILGPLGYLGYGAWWAFSKLFVIR